MLHSYSNTCLTFEAGEGLENQKQQRGGYYAASICGQETNSSLNIVAICRRPPTEAVWQIISQSKDHCGLLHYKVILPISIQSLTGLMCGHGMVYEQRIHSPGRGKI